VTHTGSYNLTPTQRAEQADINVEVHENLSFGKFVTPMEVVLNLVIDDGVKSRTNRKTLFLKDIDKIGIGFSKHSVYDYCYVINYCENYEEDEEEEEEEEGEGEVSLTEAEDLTKKQTTTTNVLLNLNDDSNSLHLKQQADRIIMEAEKELDKEETKIVPFDAVTLDDEPNQELKDELKDLEKQGEEILKDSDNTIDQLNADECINTMEEVKNPWTDGERKAKYMLDKAWNPDKNITK